MITIDNILNKLINKIDLNCEQMQFIMTQMMLGKYSPEEISAILIALRSKNESIDEILSSVKVLKDFSIKIPISDKNKLVDIVGTGGDRSKTFNVSTACCFVVSAIGAKVAKHGAGSVSSSSGSMDIFKSMGAKINLNPYQIEKCINNINMAFINATDYLPAMSNVNSIRRKLKVRTIFNILGPLLNPTGVLNLLLGVFDINLVKIYAEICKKLKLNHVMIVHSKDGLDEISIFDKTYIAELKDGSISYYEINPEQFGISISKDLDAIRVNSSLESLNIIDKIFDGYKGPCTDIVVLNSAAALCCANIVTSIDDGISLARQAIVSGKAKKKKQEFINYTNALI